MRKEFFERPSEIENINTLGLKTLFYSTVNDFAVSFL